MINKENVENRNIDPSIILPTYDYISSQIDDFRKNASKYNNGEDFSTQCYNNISILGGRGTGKTSLLIDIGKKLKEENNIVFEIITPDIRNKEDTLGWIISLLIKEIKYIQEKININNGYSFQCSICEKKYEIDEVVYELKQAYFLRKSLYETVITNEYSSKIDYLNDNENRLNADVELREVFYKLIDKYLELLNKDKKEENSTLLIFRFDDVDIHSKRINEVLNTIMVYLSHPNIVNIIAADYESAIENITIEMLQEDGVLDSEILKLNVGDKSKNILESRRDRSYDFIKKVFPPMYRHFIPKLTNEKKCEIFREYMEGRAILKELEDYIYYKNYAEEKIELYDYFSFLDDTIRGCMNVINFIKSKKIEESFISEGPKIEKFKFLRQLLNVIIESNKILDEQRELIEEIINLYQNDKTSSENDCQNINFNGYINYNAIVYDIEKCICKTNLDKKKFNLYYTIFILSNIFEISIIFFNLRKNNSDSDKKLHGLKQLIIILNLTKDNESLPLVPILKGYSNNKESIQKIIHMKQKIFKVFRYYEIQQLFKEENEGYLESVYIDSVIDKEGNSLSEYLAEIYVEDSKWVSSIVNWIIDKAPNDKMIKNKLIEDLNINYSIDINDIDTDKNVEIDKDDYFSDRNMLIISSDISIIINEFLNCAKMWDIISKNINDLEKEINTTEMRTNHLNEEKDKLLMVYKYSQSDYKKILMEIKSNRSFINDRINKELWEKVQDDVITITQDKNINLFGNLGTVKKIPINKKLNDILGKNYNNTEIETTILIKNNKFIYREEDIDFIVDYFTKKEIIDALEKHPIIKIKSYENEIIDLENELDYLHTDYDELKNQYKEIDNILKENEIMLYICKIKNKQIDIDTDRELIYKKYFTNRVGLKNRTIEEIINILNVFINQVVLFYEKDSHKSKTINLRNLLYRIINQIDELKILDKEILDKLNSLEFKELSFLGFDESYINYYKSILHKIDFSNIYLEKVINNINSDNISEDANKLINLIQRRNKQLFEEDFRIKATLYKYAFNLVLNKYLYYKIKEEREDLEEKVRTAYLRKKRDELKKSVNEREKNNLPFYEYLETIFEI
ncbi:MAG: hypothetical protein KH083_07075 [Intestinibacter bartlettii]|uniref:hypothetical protein n=1 Tax=Intestinibacter bartlettii TaxID=261299 RepID=UPI00242BDA8B|nr:hypothetical protein [Intestinibacter bartlettii]MBS7148157.1 hypothetical protein [Intestinibacter bartlettii]